MTRKEYILTEILNGVSHGIGVILGIVFLVIMLLKSHSASLTVSASIYGATFIFLFFASTIYHIVLKPNVKKILRIFDHSAIFIFIAGSYMPIIFTVLRGYQRLLFLIVIWSLALGGTVFKIATVGKYDKFKNISVLLYIIMGWLSIIMMRKMVISFPIGFFVLFLLGGITYTAGTYFYKKKTMVFSHVIWHIFVLMGAIFQFVAFYKYIYS